MPAMSPYHALLDAAAAATPTSKLIDARADVMTFLEAVLPGR
jgi:hypothetical protein